MQRRRFLKTAAGLFVPAAFGIVRAQPFQLNDPALLAATRPKGSSAPPDDTTGILVWLKADANCFTDAGKTTPCTDNSSLYTIADNSGNGFDFTQSIAGRRPVWFSTTHSQNGLPVFQTGITTFSGMLGSPSASAGNLTIFGVFALTTTTFSARVVLFDTPTGRLIIAPHSNTAGDIGYFYSGNWKEGAMTFDTSFHLWTWVLNSTGTGGFVYVDGVQKLNDTYTQVAIGGGDSGFCIQDDGGTDVLPAYMGEFRIYPSDIGSSRVSAVSAYLKYKWGTP